MKLPRAKQDWQPETRKHYRTIKKIFEIEPEILHPLLGTMERHNRYYQCQRILEKEGLTFKTQSGQVKSHPLVTEQKNAWAGYLAGLKILGFMEAEDQPKRPAHRPPKIKVLK